MTLLGRLRVYGQNTPVPPTIDRYNLGNLLVTFDQYKGFKHIH